MSETRVGKSGPKSTDKKQKQRQPARVRQSKTIQARKPVIPLSAGQTKSFTSSSDTSSSELKIEQAIDVTSTVQPSSDNIIQELVQLPAGDDGTRANSTRSDNEGDIENMLNTHGLNVADDHEAPIAIPPIVVGANDTAFNNPFSAVGDSELSDSKIPSHGLKNSSAMGYKTILAISFPLAGVVLVLIAGLVILKRRRASRLKPLNNSPSKLPVHSWLETYDRNVQNEINIVADHECAYDGDYGKMDTNIDQSGFDFDKMASQIDNIQYDEEEFGDGMQKRYLEGDRETLYSIVAPVATASVYLRDIMTTLRYKSFNFPQRF